MSSPPDPQQPRPGGARRRDRHGRGMRGPLVPPQVPLARSRSAAFDDLVLDAVEELEKRWAEQLKGVEFAVEEVPPVQEPSPAYDGPVIPLGRLITASGSDPARIVVYRRPLEARAIDRDDLGDLVRDVVVDQVAELLGLDPDEVDPPAGDAPG